ncbi:MAG: sarcosine oxidase, subunit alpha [Actinomycetota bacterium]|nr:sarcosine oxidase, subunit alpha [Actinomycetota bacterium]
MTGTSFRLEDRPLRNAAPPNPGRRLDPRPGEVIDRSAPLSFTWNGRPAQGFEGDTIVSALAASGVRVFSRSLKYHRPRGLLTASFHDPGCLVQVDDEPNVRGAHRRVEAGMRVSAQNAWPSLRFDVKAANQLVGRFLGPGFYYKTFIAPERLWPAYESVLKRFAAGGRASAEPSHDSYDKRYAHVDVLVAGGGPAGMAAAVAAAAVGASVMLVEEEYELGGHLRWGGKRELDLLAEQRAAVDASPGIEVLTNSVVTARYDDNWMAVLQRSVFPGVRERLVKARATTVVVAAGLIERPYVFAGNDLPGVMLSTAARRLVNLWAVKPGTRAVVFSANAEGDAAAADLEDAGVEITRLVDARRGENIVRALAARHGAARRTGLSAVELGDGSIVECDLLVTAIGWTAPTSLLNMAGDRPVYDPTAARFRPGDGLPDSVFVTGGLLGDGTVDELVAHGSDVGRAAAARSDARSVRQDRSDRAAGADDDAGPARPAPLPVVPHPALFRSTTHGIVDYSEDVSSKDLIGAAHEGYESVELLKRFTTVTMGSAQGKLETVNAVAVLAEATGRTIGETGTTVWRPPYAPMSLGALAGRQFEPVRRSPMQGWHEAHGARPLVAGAWIRPDHYGDPEAEVRNVRTNVGIIDVTPLGKLDLRGPDVPLLLNLLYVNKWSKLAEGAVRYGVMCGDDGVVFDDGVTGHLGPDHYVMSTTSSGAEAVLNLVEHVLATDHPEWRIHVTPVVGDYASINVAGPDSRALLGRLAPELDLSPGAFAYMQVRSATIAGVTGCFTWRIGFTGELSYELHVPADRGLHVWEALLDTGRDLGCAPFGVEAQRIMRLEKGHLIVGQDSDGLTSAYAAGLDWLVKPDKTDFLGKPELAWVAERGGPTAQLVGLQPVDGTLVPPEGCQLVEGTTIVGRITSSRMSPTLGRSIGLGYVDRRLASAGTVVSVRLPDGTETPVTVMADLAHFDPEGRRLRA